MTHAQRCAVLPVLLSALFIQLPGCGALDPKEMSEIERARKIAELREKASDQWDIFVTDPTNYEALKEFAQLHEETTKIAPGTCPRCFLRYAFAARSVGNYWRGLAEDIANDLDDSDVPDPQLDEQFNEYITNAKESYVKSNRAFDVFFRQAGPDPGRVNAYFAMVDNYAGLEDYSSALYYLDLFEQRLDPKDQANQREVEKIRQGLQQRLLFQEEKMLEGELDDDASPRRRSRRNRRRPRPQPAN